MKYIIDIEDKAVDGLYKAKNFKTLVFDEYGLSRLEKYEEEDKEKLREKIDAAMSSAYQFGCADAEKKVWRVVRKLFFYKLSANGEFGQLFRRYFGDSSVQDIVMQEDFAYTNAKLKTMESKVRQYNLDGYIREVWERLVQMNAISAEVPNVDQA